MLYKFKSKSTADLIMLEPNGRQMLQIIGRQPDASGIVPPQDMALAIAAVKAEIEREEALRHAEMAQALADGQSSRVFDGISLRQRAQPFVDMLARCEKAGHSVTWGV
jgi:hypothetical protein